MHAPVHEGEDVEHGGHVRMVVAAGLLQVLEGLLAQGHGHLVAALGGILDHQVVQGAQPGGDLVAAPAPHRGPSRGRREGVPGGLLLLREAQVQGSLSRGCPFRSAPLACTKTPAADFEETGAHSPGV